jgi:hypothetical protein
MAKKRISMDDMCGGALLQRFNMEMAKIGRNIMDPNTDPRKPRKLTISLTFKADESRKSLTTSISTSSSLAPLEPISTIMLAGQDIRTGAINIQELDNYNNSLQVAGERTTVQAEEIRPEPAQAFDPETGEIYGKPIDLRAAQ